MIAKAGSVDKERVVETKGSWSSLSRTPLCLLACFCPCSRELRREPFGSPHFLFGTIKHSIHISWSSLQVLQGIRPQYHGDL